MIDGPLSDETLTALSYTGPLFAQNHTAHDTLDSAASPISDSSPETVVDEDGENDMLGSEAETSGYGGRLASGAYTGDNENSHAGANGIPSPPPLSHGTAQPLGLLAGDTSAVTRHMDVGDNGAMEESLYYTDSTQQHEAHGFASEPSESYNDDTLCAGGRPDSYMISYIDQETYNILVKSEYDDKCEPGGTDDVGGQMDKSDELSASGDVGDYVFSDNAFVDSLTLQGDTSMIADGIGYDTTPSTLKPDSSGDNMDKTNMDNFNDSNDETSAIAGRVSELTALQCSQLQDAILDMDAGSDSPTPSLSPTMDLRYHFLVPTKSKVQFDEYSQNLKDALRPEHATGSTPLSVELSEINKGGRDKTFRADADNSSGEPVDQSAAVSAAAALGSQWSYYREDPAIYPNEWYSRQHMATACVRVLSRYISTTGGEEHRTMLDKNVIMGLQHGKLGIRQQLPPGTPYDDSEIQPIIHGWSPRRKKKLQDAFFRKHDRRGTAFTFQELLIALETLSSRPPRRINHYPAHQLCTHGVIGNGQTVSQWSRGMGHPPSSTTRLDFDTVPTYQELDAYEDEYESGVNPVMNPKKQAGNLYEPKWIRNNGSRKQGWCSHCKKGGFHYMKNSGYLYHKNHEHGIFPNGNIMEDPLVIRRKIERESKWEGLCGICYSWVDLDHQENKLWGTWYRHYKQCATEYDHFKKVLAATNAPLTLVELRYYPYRR